MTKLPVISGFDCVKALQRLGFTLRRQSGSHIILSRDGAIVTVPNHKTLKPGTLRSILRQAGLTVEEFLEAL